MLINIRPEAELDIATGYDWYEAELPGLGIEFIDALEEAFGRIAANPLHYEDLGRGVRRKLLKRFPYAVFFLFDKGEIWVLAVLQQSQSPTVLRSRP